MPQVIQMRVYGPIFKNCCWKSIFPGQINLGCIHTQIPSHSKKAYPLALLGKVLMDHSELQHRKAHPSFVSSNFYSIHTQVHFIQPLDMWGLASVMLLNSKSHNSTKLHVFSQSRLDYIIIKITIIFTVLWIRCRPWFSFLFSFHVILSKLYFFQKWALKAIFSPITDLFFSQYQTLSPLFCKDEA